MKTLPALSLALLLTGTAVCEPDSSRLHSYFNPGQDRHGTISGTTYQLSGASMHERLQSQLISTSNSEVLQPTYSNYGVIGDIHMDHWNYGNDPYLMPTDAVPWSSAAFGRQGSAVKPTFHGSQRTYAPQFGGGVMWTTNGWGTW